jgi:hypothetical protein
MPAGLLNRVGMTTSGFIGERTRERDRFELELGDAFDVKASIVLFILTFLGTISATMLLADGATRMAKLAQIPVIASVVNLWHILRCLFVAEGLFVG